jgi:hypothetical protein
MLTVLEIIRKTTEFLTAKGIESARLNAVMVAVKILTIGVFLIAAFALSACNCAPKVVPDAGTPDAAVEVDAGFDAGVDEPDAGDEDAGPKHEPEDDQQSRH